MVQPPPVAGFFQPYHDPNVAYMPVSRHSRRRSSTASGRSSPYLPASAYTDASGMPVQFSHQEPYSASTATSRVSSAQPTGYAPAPSSNMPTSTGASAIRQVSTPGILSASKGRRKNPDSPAAFACPVDGCDATFTREFNLSSTPHARAVRAMQADATSSRPLELSLWCEAILVSLGTLREIIRACARPRTS
jgi:hypothetical protein